MRHVLLAFVVFSLIVAGVLALDKCTAPADVPDVPGVELDVDIDRAKPRKTLSPKPAAPKASVKTLSPKVSMVKPQAPKPAPKR